ncbi:two component transcriptional regulator, LytTR family [Enterococcus malodoratus]|uniref:LytR/AlgR family response regulator transcription factor n=1 Tax=Enterococcus malodoratus TaxID=71451 RepID=UPI0008C84E7D|nr:LytTR family DNA-binding domain-containing protein [Enterococcus malodoratus]SET09696.1 two component transcriptional regulator, LytTR family [Enterococcus malodoratus]
MLEVVCCDDEKEMRKALMRIIEPELQLQGIEYQLREFSSGEELLSSRLESIDLLFLDIEMKALDGIETAKQLRKINQHAVIIFVTAFADFVFQGYEVKALNYILKPYGEKKIVEVLHKALDELETAHPKYFVIEQKSGITRVALKEICYFTSDRRIVTIVTAKDSITFYGKLNDLVLPDHFLRIHNRYVVNLHYVDQVEAGSLTCNQEQLPISRKYRQSLMVSFAKNMLG